jgi:hypothetical protein
MRQIPYTSNNIGVALGLESRGIKPSEEQIMILIREASEHLSKPKEDTTASLRDLCRRFLAIHSGD